MITHSSVPLKKEYQHKLSPNNLQCYLVAFFISLVIAIVLLYRTDFVIIKILTQESNKDTVMRNSASDPYIENIRSQCQILKDTEDKTSRDRKKKTVLITGGGGFVGRHFSHRLCIHGWHVVVVDNLMAAGSLEPKDWPKHLQCKSIQFHKMDCRDYFKYCDMHFELFIHLAAVVGGRAIIEGQPLLVADDLSIDSAAFQWALSTNATNMIYFSSSAAYPIKIQQADNHKILSEPFIDIANPSQDVGFPDLSYGWAKLTGEYLSYLARKQYGMKISVYRPMSGYGEDQNNAYPFMSLLERMLLKEKDFFLWSNATRDFVYIEDIVDCVLHTYQLDHQIFGMNLATGIPTSFDDLVQAIGDKIGHHPIVKVKPGMPLGVPYRVGDPKLSNSLGCKYPTSLSKGIDIALQYKASLADGPPMKSDQVNLPEPSVITPKPSMIPHFANITKPMTPNPSTVVDHLNGSVPLNQTHTTVRNLSLVHDERKRFSE